MKPMRAVGVSDIVRTCKAQLPAVIAILFSVTLTTFWPASGIYDIIVIVLLAAVIYTALRTGLRHGIISAVIVVLYTLYIVGDNAGLFWLSWEVLQRNAVITIAFPMLAIIVGGLKERNNVLFSREKIARETAEQSEQRLRFMAESMPQKIFTITPDGEPDYANPQWREYLGDVHGDDVGDNFSHLIHPDDVSENQTLWQHSLKTGEPFQYEHRLKRADGKYIWHLTRINAMRDQNGTITAWVGSSTDIEDVRRTRKLEADTARLTKQRAELMELNLAKDEFISLASHQLRTPATGVKQYVSMALDGYGGKISSKLRIFLEKANESNDRQLSVINDLLQVAQVDAGQVVLRKEAVDAGELIKGVIHEQAAKFAKRHQTVRFNERKVKVIAIADAIKLRMVIENIVDNASKYTPENKNIFIRLSRSGGKARIVVKDEGVGINQEDTEYIFQKFSRIDNLMSTEVGGTGLGLYWVRKIIDLHGGSITVTSKLGKGTTFTISLPLSDSKK